MRGWLLELSLGLFLWGVVLKGGSKVSLSRPELSTFSVNDNTNGFWGNSSFEKNEFLVENDSVLWTYLLVLCFPIASTAEQT